MDRYTLELGGIVVATVWLTAYVVSPLLETVYPAFGTPMVTQTFPEAPVYSWQYTINWSSPRLYTMLGLEATAVGAWARWRREALRQNIREKHGIDIEDVGK